MKKGILLCPICRAGLIPDGTSLRCPSGHSYDIARSGYVNLLPPGKKSNASTGDPEDMVTARREFLAGGHYDRYVREAAQASAAALGEKPDRVIDAACGEGHHTLILARELMPSVMLGVDASKKAADAGAKAAKRCALSAGSDEADVSFIAGNIFSLPVADSSFDLMTVLFAPVPDAEAYRVLRRGGCLTVCSAGEDHLIELRRMIYDEVRIKDCTPPEYAGFEVADRRSIRYGIGLTGDELRKLFMMTPFYHRAKAEAKERIAKAAETEMTVSVNCVIYRKIGKEES